MPGLKQKQKSYRNLASKSFSWLKPSDFGICSSLEIGGEPLCFAQQHSTPVVESVLRPLKRILTLLVRKHDHNKKPLKSISFEELDPQDLDSEAVRNVRKQDFLGICVWRLGLFSAEEPTGGAMPMPEDFLGYVIVHALRFKRAEALTHVYEAVIKVTSFPNAFQHAQHDYEVYINGSPYRVRGHLFCEQNGVSFLCCHASLRMALATDSEEGDVSYWEIEQKVRGSKNEPFTVHDETGENRVAPLSTVQIQEVLDSFDATVSVWPHKKGAEKKFPFLRWLYGSVECGRAAIVCFFPDGPAKAVGHTLTAFGHSLNPHTWTLEGQDYFEQTQEEAFRCFSSEAYVNGYIIADDNLGPWMFLPRYFMPGQHQKVKCVFSIRPKGLHLDSVDAELIASDILRDVMSHLDGILAVGANPTFTGIPLGRCFRHFVAESRNKSILRPVALNRSDFGRYVDDLCAKRPEAITPDLKKKMLSGHQWVWSVELTTQDLYAAQYRRVGEIVIQADSSYAEIEKQPKSHCLAYARFGEVVLTPDDDDYVVNGTQLPCHVPMHRF